jgi:A/G-specific adenine glycosylase
VASIAYGQRVAAVDGNVRRVIARVDAVFGDVARQPAAGRIAALAAELADCDRPGDVNQALMDLGAAVCTPRRPLCSTCPATGACRAEAMGCTGQVPDRARPRARRTLTAAAVVARGARGSYLIARRAEQGHLAGLWEFPLSAMDGGDTPTSAARSLLHALGLTPGSVREQLPVRHDFTHVCWLVTPVVVEVAENWDRPTACLQTDAPALDAYDAWSWAAPAELASKPTSRFMDKILAGVRG